jgi:hypothetical protein
MAGSVFDAAKTGPMFAAGNKISIEPDPPELLRQEFRNWEINGTLINYENLSMYFDENGLFIMPAFDTTVTVIYSPYLLSVTNGTGSGEYNYRDTVTIAAGRRPGYNFSGWKVITGGITLANPASPDTEFIMPANNAAVEAVYTRISSEVDPILPSLDESAPASGPDAAKEPEKAKEEEKTSVPIISSNSGFIREHISYIKGRGGNIFAPESELKRAETAQMFFNLLSGATASKTKTFPDVENGAWYAEAVNSLASGGILLGFPDGAFYPEASITRAEFAAIVVRIEANSPAAASSNKFADVPKSHWAYDYINTAADKGWIIGYEDGSYRPDRHITRAEAVALLNRVLGREADKAYIDSHSGIARFSDVPGSHWAYYDIAEAHIAHRYEIIENHEKWNE